MRGREKDEQRAVSDKRRRGEKKNNKFIGMVGCSFIKKRNVLVDCNKNQYKFEEEDIIIIMFFFCQKDLDIIKERKQDTKRGGA